MSNANGSFAPRFEITGSLPFSPAIDVSDVGDGTPEIFE
jgi:hypothetical protein